MTVRTLIAPLLIWGVLYAAYLLLAGQASTDELVAGATVAAAGSALSVAVRTGSCVRFNLRPSVWVMPGLRALAAVPREVALVGIRLLRPRSGQFEQEPLRPLPTDTQTSRAVQIIADSLAPNRFVVALVQGDRVLLHRFAGSKS